MSDNNEIFSEIVRNILLELQPIFIKAFGSQVAGTYRPDSDYDIFAVVDARYSKKELAGFSAIIRKTLASKNIDVDIIFQSEESFNQLKRFPGNVANWADKYGIFL